MMSIYIIKWVFFAPGPFLGLQKTYAVFSFWFILNTVHKYMKVKIKYRSRKPDETCMCAHAQPCTFFQKEGELIIGANISKTLVLVFIVTVS